MVIVFLGIKEMKVYFLNFSLIENNSLKLFKPLNYTVIKMHLK